MIEEYQTKVIHSKRNSAWNVVNSLISGKFKLARITYVTTDNIEITEKNRLEAFEHAEFISKCFNNFKECKRLQ